MPKARKRIRRVRDARAFARMIEEQAGTDDWTRLLYDVRPREPAPRLQITRKIA